ncbi:MAG: hypothetical protein M5R42_20095 [Rhodocyclaceae bacterium]|nr:hypothetical protein [Rhodocyclaceae bacterium]
MRFAPITAKKITWQAAETIPRSGIPGATTLFKRMGTAPPCRTCASPGASQLSRERPPVDAAETYPNIIRRWSANSSTDLLDPQITPNLWKLSAKSMRFEQHYSGGNRTRMDCLHVLRHLCPPWYSFERQRTPRP